MQTPPHGHTPHIPTPQTHPQLTHLGDPLLYLLPYLQGPSRDSEDLTYAEMPAAIPCSQPPTSPTAPQSSVIYTTVSTDLLC